MGFIQKFVKGLLLVSLFANPANSQEQQPSSVAQLSTNQWHLLETGLELGIFASPQIADNGDSLIRVLRIDPLYFELRLLNTSSSEHQQRLSAKEWCQHYGLTAAINASMYQKDYRTSVSFMRTKEHVNNPRVSKDKTILAFDRTTPDVPLVKIIDRQCENFDDWKTDYTTFVQSIRMISCTGRNVWRQQSQKWSTALIGIDRAGNVLFIHVRSQYTTHDLIDILLQLPLQLTNAMYAEGGREAQLYVQSGEHNYEFVGDYGNGFGSTSGRPIPNIVGIVRRDKRIE